MHDEGLAGNQHRFQALRDLGQKSTEPEFQKRGIRLGGYVLTVTKPEEIGDAGDRTRAELMEDTPELLWMDVPEFPRRLVEPPKGSDSPTGLSA